MMEIRSDRTELTETECRTLVKQIKEKRGCQLCANALALGSGRRACKLRLTFPRCLNEGGFELDE